MTRRALPLTAWTGYFLRLGRPGFGGPIPLTAAVVVLGRRELIDGPAWAIAIVTLVLLWRVRRIPEPALIVGGGLVGLLLRP